MTKFIDPKKWSFLKEGADDFRNGVPSCVETDIFQKKKNTVTPVIISSKKTAAKTAKKPLEKDEDDNSRLTLVQRQKIKNVQAIEHILRQHPLALYPHLEECLPPELFEEVVSLLDPEISLVTDGDNRGSAADKPGDERPAACTSPSMTSAAPTQNKTIETDEDKLSNPYRWLPEVEEVDKKDKKAAAEPTNFMKNEEEEHIKNVTQLFCDWVTSLGGDTNNIDESTITSLFSSGYETKPALSVPIHVVELASVPQELRTSAAPALPQQSATQSQTVKQEFGRSSTSVGPTERYQYGAWYLKPKEWKKRLAGEPMQNPDDIKGKEVSEAKQRSLDLDYELAPMHGVKLFMDFVDKKDTRRPEFLDHVSQIQTEQEDEEHVHREDTEHVKVKSSKAPASKPTNDKK